MNKVIETQTKRKKIVEKNSANGKKNGAKLQTSSQAEEDWDDDPFFSPLISSVKVKMKLRMGGKIEQPPIGEDDLIYFDE